MNAPDSTPGRPSLGGRVRKVTTSAFIEALLEVYMRQHPEQSESQALRYLIKRGLEGWVADQDAE